MGKKDKSKFRKQIKAQLMEEMSKFQSTETKPTQKTASFLKANIKASEVLPTTNSAAIILNGEVNLNQVRYDLKKTSIVMIILALGIGLLYWLDFKYGVLLTFGNWLFQVLHIR